MKVMHDRGLHTMLKPHIWMSEGWRSDIELESMEIQDGWDQHIKLLEKLSKQHNKPILFTETGYRSHNTATIRPWEWNNYEEIDSNSLSLTTQNLAYEALFRKLWHREWFAGVYFWQWHNTSKEGNTRESTDFTPRYKPAENTMAKWYGKSTK